jgi:hypothetical protein
MVAALDRVGAIDPTACRRSVEQRFTVGRLVTDYEALYRRLIAGRR